MGAFTVRPLHGSETIQLHDRSATDSVQTGDDALAGHEEPIRIYRFPPTSIDRVINFKGLYISIMNQDTEHQAAHEDNDTASTEYKPYKIPTGYTCYVRGATVYFNI